MGQYYEILLKGEKFEHYDRSIDGEYVPAKLMEHSWWRNPTVGAICRKLYGNPQKVWWIGDYADYAEPVNGMTEAQKLILYRKVWGKKPLKDRTLSGKDPLFLDGKYLVNITKQEYIDCDEYFKECQGEDGWVIHPLPLLTAIGNGQCGGDYRGINEDRVGSWAGDLIAVFNFPPKDYVKNEVCFKEGL